MHAMRVWIENYQLETLTIILNWEKCSKLNMQMNWENWKMKIREDKIMVWQFGRSCCIKTWESCGFKKINLRYFFDISFLTFDEYPWGTLYHANTRNFFPFLNRVWHVGGKHVLFPNSSGDNSCRIPITIYRR